MLVLKIGIMSRQQFQQRTLDIAEGQYTPKRGEPKIWFSSVKSLGEVLSENNVRLLKIMKDKKPETITELAELSGRQVANLSRTLKTFERYGIVKLIKQQRSVKPIAKATAFNIYYAV